MPDWVEDQLAGIDGPRPLPQAMHDRLERSLAGPAPAGSGLDDALVARLADSLSDPLSPWLDSLDAPRPLPPATRERMETALGAKRPRRHMVMVASAAAVVVLAGIGAAVVEAGTGSPVRSSTAAGPLTSRPSSTHAPPTGASSPSPSPSAPGGDASAGAQASTAAPGQVPSAAAAPTGPTVTSLDPPGGPTSGGTWVTVSGTGLSDATEVFFGSSPAHFVVVSATELRAQAPSSPAGTVDVVVRTPQGTSPVQPGARYSYG